MSTYETISASILGLTLFAIMAGPIAAVLVTRWGDDRREKRRRKHDVLTTLMRTRPARLSYEHVGALNLIQLEFSDSNSVLGAYGRYIEMLYQETPKEAESSKRLGDERSDRFIELLHQIAGDLGYSFDKKDLEKLSYGPQGWENDESAIRMLRSMAMDVMTGRQSLSVVMRPSVTPGPMFPPPPQVEPAAIAALDDLSNS